MTAPDTDAPPRSRLLVVGAALLVVVLVVGLVAAMMSIRSGLDADNANGSVPVDSLDDLQGRFVSINDVGAPARTVVPVEIEVDGSSMTVRTGCNGGSSVVDVDESRLVLEGDGLMSTLMACETPLMDQERWVVEMLTSTPRLDRSGPSLFLTWGEGDRYWLGLEERTAREG